MIVPTVEPAPWVRVEFGPNPKHATYVFVVCSRCGADKSADWMFLPGLAKDPEWLAHTVQKHNRCQPRDLDPWQPTTPEQT